MYLSDKSIFTSQLELPVLVAAFYGLRRGEVCGLKQDAIAFELGTLTMKRTAMSIQLNGKIQIIEQDPQKQNSVCAYFSLWIVLKNILKDERSADTEKICDNCYNYQYDGFVFVD